MIQGRKEDNTPRDVKVDDEGRVSVTADISEPLYVTSPPGLALSVDTTSASGIAKTASVLNSHTLTTTSQSYPLANEDGVYILQARGTDAYILTGDTAPTATATPVTGHSLMVMDGQTLTVRLEGKFIAWIGADAGQSFVCCPVEAA